MKLKYLDAHSIEQEDARLRLGYAHEGDFFYKVIEVTLTNIDKSYYFFENDLLDEVETVTIIPSDLKVIDKNEPINPLVVNTAINFAQQLNDIQLIDIKPDYYCKTSDEDWFRSYKVETSLGCVAIGFGVIGTTRSVLNCLYGWPYGIVSNTLKIIDTDDRYNIKKGLLFSLIGLDILQNKSAPDCVYTNPVQIEYHKAS